MIFVKLTRSRQEKLRFYLSKDGSEPEWGARIVRRLGDRAT